MDEYGRGRYTIALTRTATTVATVSVEVDAGSLEEAKILAIKKGNELSEYDWESSDYGETLEDDIEIDTDTYDDGVEDFEEDEADKELTEEIRKGNITEVELKAGSDEYLSKMYGERTNECQMTKTSLGLLV